MGAARGVWDESKVFRGYHGRFAEGRNRSQEQIGGVRGGNAFAPPTPAAVRRARKERVPTKVRGLREIYDKRDRGERLSWKEEGQISWASPRKLAEQRAKTGDTVVPRGEMVRRERSYANSVERPTAARTGIKRTFTGKAKVERGNYREYLVPTPGRAGSADVKFENRVRRSFDWPKSGKRKSARQQMSAAAAPPSPKPRPSFNPVLVTDSRLREIARQMGLDIPKRAGRNQLLKLIQGA
jgi:hypothetical protein